MCSGAVTQLSAEADGSQGVKNRQFLFDAALVCRDPPV